MIDAIEPPVYWIPIALLASLIVGSVTRFISLRNAEEALRRQRLASLRTWWLLAIAVSAALLVGRLGICVLLGVASCVAWRTSPR
jgi:predicted CDP-diglyceride synthetase/phosphatidate cytidylyltransferase